MSLSFFTLDADDPEVLLPTSIAQALWGPQIHGVALSGLLARAAERAVLDPEDGLGRTDLRAARWTVDLFRPAAMEPGRARVAVVRESPRLCLVDVAMEQAGETVARASALFLKATGPAPGAVWEPTGSPELPPLDVAPPSTEPDVPLFGSDVDGAGMHWSRDFSEHQDSGRKATWQVGLPVVAGETPSGFVAAASIADATSMVTNWGTGGVEHINTDITLTLARPPAGIEIGLLAVDRVSRDGIAVGTVTVFDREGRLGTGVVTSLANARRAVDLSEGDPRFS